VQKIKSYEERSCTDVLWFLLYLAACAAVLAIMGVALSRGANINSLIYGTDYRGAACGQGVNADKPFMAYPCLGCIDLTGLYPENTIAYKATICVKTCSETLTDSRIVLGMRYNSTALYGVCVPQIPSSGNITSAQSNSAASSTTSASAAASLAIADLYKGWKLILGSVFLALMCAFLYLKVVQRWGHLLVYTALALVLAGGVFVSYVFWQQYVLLRDATPPSDSTTVTTVQALAITIAAITFLYFLAIVFMWKRIQIAIQ